MKYTFQHYIDISTSAESMQIISVNAGGQYLINRCRHLLGTYKYYKLGKVSIRLVPASTLPVDPLGLSYADTDPQTVDPRDQLNPGLVRITNGEDFQYSIDGVSSASQDEIYKAMMLDPRWSKFMLQSGFRRSASPLFWSVGQLHQDAYPGSTVNVFTKGTGLPQTNSWMFSSTRGGTIDVSAAMKNLTAEGIRVNCQDSDPHGFFQTGHRQRMSWLPTDMLQQFAGGSSIGTTDMFTMAGLNPILAPNIITCILPRAYKTLYYYRLFITETVYFSGIKNVGLGIEEAESLYEYNGLDNFTNPMFPTGVNPVNGIQILKTYSELVTPPNDGDSDD